VEVLEKLEEKQARVAAIKRKNNWIGHVLRGGGLLREQIMR